MAAIPNLQSRPGQFETPNQPTLFKETEAVMGNKNRDLFVFTVRQEVTRLAVGIVAVGALLTGGGQQGRAETQVNSIGQRLVRVSAGDF